MLAAIASGRGRDQSEVYLVFTGCSDRTVTAGDYVCLQPRGGNSGPPMDGGHEGIIAVILGGEPRRKLQASLAFRNPVPGVNSTGPSQRPRNQRPSCNRRQGDAHARHAVGLHPAGSVLLSSSSHVEQGRKRSLWLLFDSAFVRLNLCRQLYRRLISLPAVRRSSASPVANRNT
jgi:hypothetical protein